MAKETKKENAQAVVEAVSKTDVFFKENKKTLIYCAAAVVVLALAVFCFQKYYYMPKKAEALGQLYPCENLFQAGNYEEALEGNGAVIGFAEVIKEYGAKAGKAAYMYAGVCELQLGNFEEALKYLKKYNGKDNILAARAIACEGDAYVGLEEYNKAVACFEKAAKKSANLFSAAYLMKAGAVYEVLEQNEKALACYEQIKEEYPMSAEAMEIEKYITRIEK